MRDRDGFVLVFSLSDRSSFEALEPFHDQLVEMHEDEQIPPLILVGNKADVDEVRPAPYICKDLRISVLLSHFIRNEFWNIPALDSSNSW